jgi:two-component system CheB/CheR fusion protein
VRWQTRESPQKQDGIPDESKPTVVGIGASAGGLAALKQFFDQVPADSGLIFVVVVTCRPNTRVFSPTCSSRTSGFPCSR